MSELLTLTPAEEKAQAEFKARFEIPYSQSKYMTLVDREIVRLTAYFDEYKNDRFFRQQYKLAWAKAGYSEYVFEHYRLEHIGGILVTTFCKEDAGN